MDAVSKELLKDSSASSAKLSNSLLKAYLKSNSLSQSGDKPTLFTRCCQHRLIVKHGLLLDGVPPHKLSGGDLKKKGSRVGVSPMGNNDEVFTAVVDYLVGEKMKEIASSNNGKNSNSNNGDSDDDNEDDDEDNTKQKQQQEAAPPKVDPIALATRVLSLSDASQITPIIILNLSDPTLTATSPVAQLRKSYLKLSLAIHPDRIGRVYKDATKAFQVLVTAFEALSKPQDLPSDDAKGGKKSKVVKIQRSNAGCHRTIICCPRCSTPWGSPVEGNPDYFYNVMLMGLKAFNCATCLCAFGCMSAVHKCPHCKSVFEYSPDDFHRKISCGSESCKKNEKTFGFYEYHISDRAMTALRVEIVTAREVQAKTLSGMKRRAESNKRRNGEDEDTMNDLAFAAGLLDVCPRCGMEFSEMGGDEGQRTHLSNCTDSVAIKKHTAKKQKIKEGEENKDSKANKQKDAEALASWKFLGSNNEQLYLLSESQLNTHAANTGAETTGNKSKSELISSIIKKGSSDTLVVRDNNKKGKVTTSTMPSISTLQRMDLEELLAVCAGHGVVVKRGSNKREVLRVLEKGLMEEEEDDEVEVLMLGNGENGGGKGKVKVDSTTSKGKGKKGKKVIGVNSSSESESEEEDSEGEYNDDDSD